MKLGNILFILTTVCFIITVSLYYIENEHWKFWAFLTIFNQINLRGEIND